ncbi:MAG: hypothetical protein UZ14_CFX002001490 [Chloroflexi bacterium OLB14]|nr:MAG: hypothetical protein UZ14_CFX002001490 [Chloroflexi bacterium OLB14]
MKQPTKQSYYFMSSIRKKLIYFSEFATKIFFGLTIIFIPFRWRIDLLPRPMPPLYGDYTNFQLFISDITLICLLIFWLTSIIINPKKNKKLAIH